jgi:4-hydroxy-tetrahydrodipicolinate reductase
MAAESRVLVVGACGRMGVQVRKAVAQHPSLRVTAALERSGHPELGREIEPGVHLTDDLKGALAASNVVIDFSIPSSTLTNLRGAAEAGVAYVTGTTGFSKEETGEIASLAEKIPVVHAPNFSLAVNVLGWLTRQASRLLGDEFDAEIFEIHALFLASAVAEGRGQVLADHLVLERAGEIGARPAGAIGVQTLRGGDNPGEHTVYFVGQGERIELIHRSSTREHFARGSVRVAAWLVGKPPGLYPISEVFDLS